MVQSPRRTRFTPSIPKAENVVKPPRKPCEKKKADARAQKEVFLSETSERAGDETADHIDEKSRKRKSPLLGVMKDKSAQAISRD